MTTTKQNLRLWRINLLNFSLKPSLDGSIYISLVSVSVYYDALQTPPLKNTEHPEPRPPMLASPPFIQHYAVQITRLHADQDSIYRHADNECFLIDTGVLFFNPPFSTPANLAACQPCTGKNNALSVLFFQGYLTSWSRCFWCIKIGVAVGHAWR